MTKRFGLRADEIRRLLPALGSCYASDRITVDCQPVGFMYREPPDDKFDSGWRFFAGDENQEYVDNPKNCKLYDVNTIANYDPAIIDHIHAPPYSAFERHTKQGPFVPTRFPDDPDAKEL
jgi:hypothetical protein